MRQAELQELEIQMRQTRFLPSRREFRVMCATKGKGPLPCGDMLMRDTYPSL